MTLPVACHARYADTFKLNIALFGATLPSQSLLPKGALSGIVLNDKLKGLGATVLTGAPASYESCDFVDNVVMKQYVKPMSHNLTGQPANRCTEHHFYAKEEGKPMYLRYERYWTTYWIFNEEFALPAPGEYYVASWLTDRNTGAVMNGKYEMTMGPYTWYGYADAATTAQTQEQGTTCTCGYNKADFDEQNLGKIGIGQDLLEYRLQPERCHSLAGGANNSLSGGGEIDTCRAGGLVRGWVGLARIAASTCRVLAAAARPPCPAGHAHRPVRAPVHHPHDEVAPSDGRKRARARMRM